MSTININKLSESLLLAVKMEKPSTEIEQNLASLDLELLFQQLKDDSYKKAFWINLYNAFFQILRKEKQVEKPEIYKGKFIDIAGQKLSLDDIEHGVLRRYRYKFSLGYLPNLFADKLIKDLAVDTIDYRIHFALNCGAASCPPIAFYTQDKIEQQLELATLSFLESETEVDKSKKEIRISKLFIWFQGDFGGPKGIRKILTDKLKVDTKGFKMKYRDYSWEEQLSNYSEIGFGGAE